MNTTGDEFLTIFTFGTRTAAMHEATLLSIHFFSDEKDLFEFCVSSMDKDIEHSPMLTISCKFPWPTKLAPFSLKSH